MACALTVTILPNALRERYCSPHSKNNLAGNAQHYGASLSEPHLSHGYRTLVVVCSSQSKMMLQTINEPALRLYMAHGQFACTDNIRTCTYDDKVSSQEGVNSRLPQLGCTPSKLGSVKFFS